MIDTYAPGLEQERTASKYLSTKRALWRIKQKNLTINSVINVGASDGRWSQICMEFYPEAQYLLIDANKIHEEKLRLFCLEHPNCHFIMAAAGNKSGDCFFDGRDPFGGAAYSSNITPKIDRQVRMIRVDDEVQRLGLKPPYFLKLDTHTFEREILAGAENILKDTALLEIEAYNFHHTPINLLFWELCALLDNYGFAVIDLSEPMWRERDTSFWQIDLFFIKKNHPVFDYIEYK